LSGTYGRGDKCAKNFIATLEMKRPFGRPELDGKIILK
jgi:hypothetical protein